MGLTFNLGRVSPSVFTDSSLNVGIGAAPSGSYKLEVTGTAKVSSTLLLGGALTGTSATFSGNVGLGSLNSSWQSTASALQAGTTVALSAYGLSKNLYFDGTDYRALTTGYGTLLQSASGNFSFYSTTASVTAGSVATLTSSLLTITSTGNVGIGTSTMAYAKFNVFNNTNDATYDSKIQAVFGNADYQDSDAIQNYGAGTSETQFLVGSTSRPAMISMGGNIAAGEPVGIINFFRSTNTDTYRSRAWIWSATNTTGTANQHGGYLAFSTAADGGTNPQERMRITSGGNVGIGTTGFSDVRCAVTGVDTTSSNFVFICKNGGGTNLFNLRNDGFLTTGTAASSPFNNTTTSLANTVVFSDGGLGKSTSSSQRFKDNIADWNGNGLKTILALKPKTFNYKANYYKHPDVVMLGLIAEDVAEVSPYLADYENEDRTGQVENVRYANIVVPLIKAIQELNERLNKAGL
jgi:hypothetical protein